MGFMSGGMAIGAVSEVFAITSDLKMLGGEPLSKIAKAGILSVVLIFAGAASPCPPDVPQDRFAYSSWWAAPGYWQRRIDLQRDAIEGAKKPFDLVLVGDSITQNWEGWVDGISRSNLLSRIAQGRISWAEAHVEPMRNWTLLTNEFAVLNLGISGDDTRHVIWRLTEGRCLEGYRARYFAVMVGTNNVRDAPEDVAKAVGKIVKLIVSGHPEATVLLYPIFPRGKTPDDPRRRANEEVNRIIRRLVDGKRVVWSDFTARLIDGNGVLSAEMMSDYLHPCECGYAIWREELLPYLRKKDEGGLPQNGDGPLCH